MARASRSKRSLISGFAAASGVRTLGKLIESLSGGRLVFHLDSLYPLLYRLEDGWIKGTWVENTSRTDGTSSWRRARRRTPRPRPHATTNTARGIGIRPLRDHLVGTSTRLWMLMLLAAVGLVLLIACANVANLWLARASVQQRDTAVRAALGASRGRLVQRVLIESLVVSAAGTVAGLALAWWCVRALATALPESLARVATVGIDARVLAALKAAV